MWIAIRSALFGGFVVASLWWAAPCIAAGDFPGLPPDCWRESRNFHAGTEGDYWEKHTQVSRIRAEKPPPGEFSPNKGYYFVRQGDWPTAKILVYAEKESLTQIEFTGLSGLGTVNWINEKLLFIRVWWGRITGNDLIFDVESGTMIYTEQFWDGQMARRQFLDNCSKVGCNCVGGDKAR